MLRSLLAPYTGQAYRSIGTRLGRTALALVLPALLPHGSLDADGRRALEQRFHLGDV